MTLNSLGFWNRFVKDLKNIYKVKKGTKELSSLEIVGTVFIFNYF